MSNTVWDAEKGWHDGPEVSVAVDASGKIVATEHFDIEIVETIRHGQYRNRRYFDVWSQCIDSEHLRAFLKLSPYVLSDANIEKVASGLASVGYAQVGWADYRATRKEVK